MIRMQGFQSYHGDTRKNIETLPLIPDVNDVELELILFLVTCYYSAMEIKIIFCQSTMTFYDLFYSSLKSYLHSKKQFCEN